jgi:hypothetical protein
MTNLQRNFTVSSLLALTIIAFGSLAYACTPGGPDAWYTETIALDQSSIPAGVAVSYDASRNAFSIKNSGSEAFYIVGPYHSSSIRYPNSGLPNGYEPKYKIISGKVWFFTDAGRMSYSGSECSGGVCTNQGTWQLNTDGAGNAQSEFLLNIREAHLFGLVYDSKQVYQDDRPANVSVPASQNFSFEAVYAGRLVTITGTIQYSLNTNYDPKARQKGIQGCADFNQRIYGGLPVGGNTPVVTSVPTTGNPTSVQPSPNMCPRITATLSFGSRSSGVTALQQYLISQNLLAVDSATGYFGRLTQAAVQKWQCQRGITCTGSPTTTGYGSVGPRTRAALMACFTN